MTVSIVITNIRKTWQKFRSSKEGKVIMTMHQSFEVTDRVSSEIQPYVRAMMGASGLNEFDAVTSVLFAIATHTDLEQYPILVYLGARATGKSEAMRQLFPMCKGARQIQGTTFPAHRNALKEGVRTAFVDEVDTVESNVTDLYTKRYSKQTGTVQVNEPVPKKGYELVSHDIFGATVMAKRTPIADVALRSRAIIIYTAFRGSGDYRYTQTGDVSGIAYGLANKVKRGISEIGDVDRVWQTWSP
ncbi:hypothetical protein ACFLT8_06090 [Chloroflexota bacterium]